MLRTVVFISVTASKDDAMKKVQIFRANKVKKNLIADLFAKYLFRNSFFY